MIWYLFENAETINILYKDLRLIGSSDAKIRVPKTFFVHPSSVIKMQVNLFPLLIISYL